MNPVLLLTHNNLALTQRCVESVRKQDIPKEILIIDNGSTDETDLWLSEEVQLNRFMLDANKGVSYGWNVGLFYWLRERQAGHVLVLNNDTYIPPYFYRELLTYEVPFVTGFDVKSMDEIETCPSRYPLQPHPDFSAFLIRQPAWETIGPFNDAMKIYCSDCDYHIRGHRLGVGMWKATVPYYHERSSTMRLAPPEERDAIAAQAGEDRKVFQSLYGCIPGDASYANLFREEMFGIDAK